MSYAKAQPSLSNRGAVVITGISQEAVKVQFLERRSYQNFFPRFDETYIDELDLGKWPSIYPDNSPTGGGAQPRPGEEVSYASPAQLWGRTEDYTALPWVNNSSGNLQNCAKWNATASKYEWKVNPDDEDDTDFSRGLSFQPYLLWLTKKICEALGYAYDFSLWEQSDYRHLLLMNTTPYANSNLARLNERLDEPFVTVNTVTGDKGIKQAQDEYQRLMNNKSPKNKRK